MTTEQHRAEQHRAISVRDVEAADLDAIAAMHIQAFADSILSRLGTEAVRRNYLWQFDGPHDLTALIASDATQPLGFLFGGVFRGSTIGFIKREKWFLLRRVLTHPAILLGSVGWNRVVLGVRLLLRRSPTPSAENPAAVPAGSFGVLSVAVDPVAQGRGVGGTLMAEARLRAIQQSFVRMHLSVHSDNANALQFYRSLGWTELKEPDGRWIGRMTLALDDGG